MSVSRICPKCKTWNKDQDYCQNCGYVLNYEIQRQREFEQKELENRSTPPNKWDVIIHKFKYHRWWPVRVAFYLFYSIWFVLFSIVSFFIALIALTPG